MDVVFLTHRVPFPPDKGDKIRANAILRHLAAQHRIHLACFVDDPADLAHVENLRRDLGGECLFVPLSRRRALSKGLAGLALNQPITCGYYASARVKHWLAQLIHDKAIGAMVAFGSAMAPYVLSARGFHPSNAILDMVDVDSDKWRQYASGGDWRRRWIYGAEAKRLLGLERKAVRSFGATIVVSPFEADTLAGLVPDAADRIFSISNGVDLERFNPAEIYQHPFLDRRAIVMTGAMDYWPNVEGAAWFAKHVLPRVLDRAPDARFYVVGSNPAREVTALAGPHVTVTGRVKDIRPYLAHAAVAVAPLRISRGVQNKVLEAMAMARPVVATREATRALQVTSGNELWIENDPDRFATAIVTALSAPEAKDVAARGRGYVERSHNWSRNLAPLDLLLESVTGRTVLPACESTTIDSGGRIHRPMMSEAPLAGAE